MNKNTEESNDIPRSNHRDPNADIDYSHRKTNQWEPSRNLQLLINITSTIVIVFCVAAAIFGIVIACNFGGFG